MKIKNENSERELIAGADDTGRQKEDLVTAALRRLSAIGIDPIVPRCDCLVALNLSAPTVSRMQRRAELPLFEEISPGRKGWRRAILAEVLDGRRDWQIESSVV